MTVTTFDTPTTATLAAFLAREAYGESPRVIGLTITEKEVHIYTNPKIWLHRDGSNVFHGYSETQAIRNFHKNGMQYLDSSED